MRLAALALVALSAAPTLAQGAKLARDDWWITWTGKTKAGWGHDRLEEVPDGFVLVRRSWTLTGTDALVERETRTETDANGEVRRETTRERGPFGPIEATTQADAGGLTWEVKVRARPAMKGRIEGPVYDPAVVALQTLRGRQPMGKRRLRLLAVPGKAMKEVDFEVEREQADWVVKAPDQTCWYDASGGLVRRRRASYPDEVTLRVASEARAKDKAVKPPAGALPAVEAAAEGGARVKRPAGRGWVLLHGTGDEPQVGLDHASGVYCLAITLPWRTPSDPKLLLKIADDLKAMVDAGADGKDSITLAAPRAATWRGRPAVRFDLGGFLAMAPIAGEAYVVGPDGGALFLALSAAPTDLADACKKEVAAAAAAIELVAGASETWARLDLQGGSLELPRGWRASPEDPAVAASPLGGSNVSLLQARRPEAMHLGKTLDTWARTPSTDPTLEGYELVKEVAATVDGRELRRIEWTARQRAADGPGARLRGVCLLGPGEAGQYCQLSIVAQDVDFDLAAVDRVIASARWKR